MSEEDEQLRVRVAWLYFMEGLTQGDIAGKLGITRLRANRLLGEARASGLVNIQVNARLADCVRPGETIARLGGDEFAVLVPDADDRAADEVAERISAALSRPVAPPMTK